MEIFVYTLSSRIEVFDFIIQMIMANIVIYAWKQLDPAADKTKSHRPPFRKGIQIKWV